MQLWPMILREDRRRVELICPHGVGHPSEKLSSRWASWMGVHGCDGCCGKKEFEQSELHHLKKRGDNDADKHD